MTAAQAQARVTVGELNAPAMRSLLVRASMREARVTLCLSTGGLVTGRVSAVTDGLVQIVVTEGADPEFYAVAHVVGVRFS